MIFDYPDPQAQRRHAPAGYATYESFRPWLRDEFQFRMRIVTLAKERDPGLYSQLVGFPQDLPNLKMLKPPRNSRKEGLDQSWIARRERGELPDAY